MGKALSTELDKTNIRVQILVHRICLSLTSLEALSVGILTTASEICCYFFTLHANPVVRRHGLTWAPIYLWAKILFTVGFSMTLVLSRLRRVDCCLQVSWKARYCLVIHADEWIFQIFLCGKKIIHSGEVEMPSRQVKICGTHPLWQVMGRNSYVKKKTLGVTKA